MELLRGTTSWYLLISAHVCVWRHRLLRPLGDFRRPHRQGVTALKGRFHPVLGPVLHPHALPCQVLHGRLVGVEVVVEVVIVQSGPFIQVFTCRSTLDATLRDAGSGTLLSSLTPSPSPSLVLELLFCTLTSYSGIVVLDDAIIACHISF